MEKIFIVFCETPGNPHYIQVTDTDIIARAKRGIFKGKGEA